MTRRVYFPAKASTPISVDHNTRGAEHSLTLLFGTVTLLFTLIHPFAFHPLRRIMMATAGRKAGKAMVKGQIGQNFLASAGFGRAVGVGLGVTTATSIGVGEGISIVGVAVGGTGVGVSVGIGVGVSVGTSVGVSVGTGVGVSVGTGVGTSTGRRAFRVARPPVAV
jgi:hypothetical protein